MPPTSRRFRSSLSYTLDNHIDRQQRHIAGCLPNNVSRAMLPVPRSSRQLGGVDLQRNHETSDSDPLAFLLVCKHSRQFLNLTPTVVE